MKLGRSFLCSGCSRKKGQPHAKDCKRVIVKAKRARRRDYRARTMDYFARLT